MLWTRVASGVVLGPLFLIVVYLETPWFNILAGVLGLMVAFEYVRMTGLVGVGEKWHWRAVLIMAAPFVAVSTLAVAGPLIAFASVVVLALVFSVSGRIGARNEPYQVQAAIPYAALPTLALAYVMNVGDAVSIFWLLAVVWATDIGAYAFGRLIGGPKLAPSISPNKTWSGALGGMVSAVLVASALLWVYGLTATLGLAGLAAVLSAISQSGDLFESGLKRRYQVKDSGNLIPGHGGIMDRFDGLWAAAPAMAMVCVVLQGGVQQW